MGPIFRCSWSEEYILLAALTLLRQALQGGRVPWQCLSGSVRPRVGLLQKREEPAQSLVTEGLLPLRE